VFFAWYNAKYLAGFRVKFGIRLRCVDNLDSKHVKLLVGKIKFE